MTWTWVDAVFAAALATGLWVPIRPVAARFGPAAAGTGVAAALVLGFAGTVLSRGEPVARAAVGVIVIASAVAVATRLHRRRSGAARTDAGDRNVIAPPIRR